jgi:rhodanese-related sulfurtransferase
LVTPSPTAEGPTKADVPRIGVAEAKAMAESGSAILVDVRTEATYEGRHIAGALSMPVDQVAQRYAELPSDKLVIFYCA